MPGKSCGHLEKIVGTWKKFWVLGKSCGCSEKGRSLRLISCGHVGQLCKGHFSLKQFKTNYKLSINISGCVIETFTVAFVHV